MTPEPKLIGLHVGKRVLAQVRAESCDVEEATVEKVGQKRVVVRFDDGRRATRSPDQLEDPPAPETPIGDAVLVRNALAAALPEEWHPTLIANSPESITVQPPGQEMAWQIWVEQVV